MVTCHTQPPWPSTAILEQEMRSEKRGGAGSGAEEHPSGRPGGPCTASEIFFF